MCVRAERVKGKRELRVSVEGEGKKKKKVRCLISDVCFSRQKEKDLLEKRKKLDAREACAMLLYVHLQIEWGCELLLHRGCANTRTVTVSRKEWR